MAGPENITTTIERFLTFLTVGKGRTSLTASHYRDYLRRFAQNTGIRSASDITSAQVAAFRKQLSRERLSHASQNYHLIALRNFIRWIPKDARRLSHTDIFLYPAAAKKNQTPPSSIITRVITAPERDRAKLPIITARDQAIIELLYSLKLNIQDIVELQRDDVNLREHTVQIARRDGYESVKLNQHGEFFISRYLNHRTDADPHLFIAHDRGRRKRTAQKNRTLSYRSVQRIVAGYSRASGYGSQVTARVLKHKYSLRAS